MLSRAYERISVQVEAKVYCNTTVFSGIIVNASENGLFLKTHMDFPFDMNIQLLIPTGDGILHLPVKVTRIVKSDDIYDGLGVELMQPSPPYLEFVKTLKNQ